jgi:hypothetical protein
VVDTISVDSNCDLTHSSGTCGSESSSRKAITQILFKIADSIAIDISVGNGHCTDSQWPSICKLEVHRSTRHCQDHDRIIFIDTNRRFRFIINVSNLDERLIKAVRNSWGTNRCTRERKCVSIARGTSSSHVDGHIHKSIGARSSVEFSLAGCTSSRTSRGQGDRNLSTPLVGDRENHLINGLLSQRKGTIRISWGISHCGFQFGLHEVSTDTRHRRLGNTFNSRGYWGSSRIGCRSFSWEVGWVGCRSRSRVLGRSRRGDGLGLHNSGQLGHSVSNGFTLAWTV